MKDEVTGTGLKTGSQQLSPLEVWGFSFGQALKQNFGFDRFDQQSVVKVDKQRFDLIARGVLGQAAHLWDKKDKAVKLAILNTQASINKCLTQYKDTPFYRIKRNRNLLAEYGRLVRVKETLGEIELEMAAVLPDNVKMTEPKTPTLKT